MSLLGLDPDPAPMLHNDLVADREANAGACVLSLGVEALKHAEDPLGVLRGDPNAVVSNRETPRQSSMATPSAGGG